MCCSCNSPSSSPSRSLTVGAVVEPIPSVSKSVGRSSISTAHATASVGGNAIPAAGACIGAAAAATPAAPTQPMGIGQQVSKPASTLSHPHFVPPAYQPPPVSHVPQASPKVSLSVSQGNQVGSGRTEAFSKESGALAVKSDGTDKASEFCDRFCILQASCEYKDFGTGLQPELLAMPEMFHNALVADREAEEKVRKINLASSSQLKAKPMEKLEDVIKFCNSTYKIAISQTQITRYIDVTANLLAVKEPMTFLPRFFLPQDTSCLIIAFQEKGSDIGVQFRGPKQGRFIPIPSYSWRKFDSTAHPAGVEPMAAAKEWDVANEVLYVFIQTMKKSTAAAAAASNLNQYEIIERFVFTISAQVHSE